MMWRFEVGEEGQATLPPIDLDEPIVTIGSGATARIRLPASAAREVHARIEGDAWSCDGERGTIGAGHTFAIGPFRVRVAPAPAGVAATPPQRTESLARELVRGLLGGEGAPSLTVERTGEKRALAPPESVLVIGRGDGVDWQIHDGSLSPVHAEIRWGWDGVTLRDLDSKAGTRVDGKRVATVTLRDGQRVELGGVALRFRDPVARPAVARQGLSPVFWIAVAVCVLAIAGLAWVLAA